VKAFVSYRHTGADEAEFRPQLEIVRTALREIGVEPFCTFFDVPVEGERPSPAQFMAEGFRMIDQSDFLFVLQASPERSEGMLMEVGYCLAKQIPVVVAKRAGIGATYLPQMAQCTFEWEDLKVLNRRIQEIDLAKLTARA
jgi:nucleoside 2-deoxyribosyltransferase